MTCPRTFDVNAVKSCSICLLFAAIDPMPLCLFGCVIILLALALTWRPMTRSES